MTKITIKEDPKDMTLALYAEGHAGYANIGHDIVCAAISILTQTFAQIALALREQGAGVVYDVSDGAVRVEIDATSCELFDYATCALQVLEVGYRLLAKKHPDYIKITTHRLECGKDDGML